MQRLDKYGLITLVFLLVTFIAVVVWGDGHADKLKGLLVSADEPASAGQLLPVAQSKTERSASQVQPKPTRSVSAPETPLRLVSRGESTLRRPPLASARTSTETSGASRELKSHPRRPTPAVAVVETPKPKPVPAQPERNEPRQQPSLQKYVVQAGDTLSEIAQAQLGSSRRWSEIVELNPGVDAAHLHVGQRLDLPSKDAVAQRSEPASGSEARSQEREAARPTVTAKPGTYVVQAGDTLSGIALAKLGSAKSWKSIVAANPGLEPERLFVGQSIKLPGSEQLQERAPSRNLVAAASKASSDRRSKVR